jgi:hypothetical protein
VIAKLIWEGEGRVRMKRYGPRRIAVKDTGSRLVTVYDVNEPRNEVRVGSEVEETKHETAG